MYKIKPLIALLGISIIISCSLHNQTMKKDSNFPKLNIADEVIIHSEILNEDREIYVYNPASGENDTNRYPVLYLMDGDFLTPVVASQIHALTKIYKFLPPMIIVGINNYKHDRGHDLTPTNSLVDIDGVVNQNYKSSGGGNVFIEFIERELVPHVESNYNTNSYRILSGMSLGGLMSLHCLVNKDIFNAYIAVSPASWWDNNYLLKEFDNYFKTNKIDDKKIFISISNEIDVFSESVFKLDSIFTHNVSENGYKFNRYPDELHGSGAVKAIYDGLKFIYSDEWDKAVSESLNLTNLYSERGYYNLESGDSLLIESSIGDFTKVIELKPDDANAYAQRALGKARVNRHEQAIKDFNEAEELGINFPVFYYNRGSSYFSIKNYKKAVSDFKKFDELMPNNLYTYYMLGESFKGLNQFEEAVEYYNKCLKLIQDSDQDSQKKVRNTIIEMGFTPEY